MGWGGTSSPSGLFKEYLVEITPQTALLSARAIQPGACQPRCVQPFTGTARCPAQVDSRSPPDCFLRLPIFRVLNKYRASAPWILIPLWPEPTLFGYKGWILWGDILISGCVFCPQICPKVTNKEPDKPFATLAQLQQWLLRVWQWIQDLFRMPPKLPGELCKLSLFGCPLKESGCSPLLTLLREKTSPKNGSDKTPEGVLLALICSFIWWTAAYGCERELILSHARTRDRAPFLQSSEKTSIGSWKEVLVFGSIQITCVCLLYTEIIASGRGSNRGVLVEVSPSSDLTLPKRLPQAKAKGKATVYIYSTCNWVNYLARETKHHLFISVIRKMCVFCVE